MPKLDQWDMEVADYIFSNHQVQSTPHLPYLNDTSSYCQLQPEPVDDVLPTPTDQQTLSTSL